MRKHLLGLMLIAGLAGCTAGPESDRSATSADATADTASQAGVLSAPSLARLRGSDANFASLPDRGELLAYGGARKSRQSGAYTYHPVSISEAHALNAIGSGQMVINTPDGKALGIGYERHEEHPDGNWTWIGRNADGSSAVLTFGERAVFGVVSSGGQDFRVRSDAAGAWIVETDRTRLVPGGGLRQGGPDFLQPPGDGVLAAAATGPGVAKAAASAVPVKAGAVIDVLVGYSGGLVSRLGSEAAAATLTANRVSLANAAYANSGVTMRLRLVHAMRVDYADTSDNQDALQKMTGYSAQTQQPITVDSAFNALRSARDEYGADAVVFLRAYREPEQDGCGIAWLLGMNQSDITVANDAEFAYAVVSDGEDRDESDNNTYFCSGYSLAHELGHVMGQAHNSEDATGRAGAHVDSYGYRETSASGFHTIMAYPLADTQVEIPHFANPQINFAAGRPTGVANQSNNARSMNITMPIIAGFRAMVVPLSGVKNDFNGDGVSDLLWRHNSSGQNYLWLSASTATQRAILSPDRNWKVAGTGDFNGDGQADILWRNSVTGANSIWLSADASTQRAVTTVADVRWQVVGIGDFDGDGVSDILWRHSVSGKNSIWRSANVATQMSMTTVADQRWRVAGVGDFNGDGRSDVLWRHSGNGRNSIWLSASVSTQQSVQTLADQRWTVVGIADFDGDGRSDILLRHSASGKNAIWRGGSVSTQQSIAAVADTGWRVVGTGDYNGDGRADILWRHAVSGRNSIWRSANVSTTQAVTTLANVNYVSQPTLP